LMKNAISRVFREDVIRDAEVVPTSTMQMPTEEPVLPTEPLVAAAIAKRAELAESQIDLSTRELSADAVANALLPIVNPSAYYGGSGLGGNLNPALPICSGTVTIRCFNPSKAPPPFRHQTSVGYGSELGQLFNSTATDKGAAVTMDVTLGNREAQANQIRSQLELAQARVRLQQLQNQVRIEVRNAQFDVQQNRASVKAAQEGVDYAQKNLYAEQRKLQVGVGTPDAVLQNQSAMTTARGNLLSALAAYQESQVELDRATGLLLEHAGIQIGDALKGQVITMPNLPHVVPAQAEPAALPPIQ
jgi:outer membrane protein